MLATGLTHTPPSQHTPPPGGHSLVKVGFIATVYILLWTNGYVLFTTQYGVLADITLTILGGAYAAR
jgi:hypothetical protein